MKTSITSQTFRNVTLVVTTFTLLVGSAFASTSLASEADKYRNDALEGDMFKKSLASAAFRTNPNMLLHLFKVNEEAMASDVGCQKKSLNSIGESLQYLEFLHELPLVQTLELRNSTVALKNAVIQRANKRCDVVVFNIEELLIRVQSQVDVLSQREEEKQKKAEAEANEAQRLALVEKEEERKQREEWEQAQHVRQEEIKEQQKNLPTTLRTLNKDEFCKQYGDVIRHNMTPGYYPEVDLRPDFVKEAKRRGLKFNQTSITSEQISIGMNTCQLYAAWGLPEDRNRSVGSWGVHEQLVYGSFGPYIYLRNGVISSFQD